MSSLFRYKLTSGEVEQIAKIYQSGISISAINRAYGFSFRSRAIENALHRAGIEVLKGKRKIPVSQEQNIINDYLLGMNNYQLGEKYNVYAGTIHTLLKRNNIETRSNRDLDDIQEQELINDYLNGLSTQALNIKYNTTNSHRILRRHRIQTRKAGHNSRRYSLNECAFDDLNNEQSAYWLGFGYAEGSITKESFTIALSTKDVEHLEKFKSFLCYDASIKFYQVKTPQGKLKDACRLSVHSQKITRKLRTLGIVKKRRWFNQLLLENLPKEMYRHFIRGLVDGDGSLDKSKRNNARIRIYEQEDILTWISQVFNSELDIPIKLPIQRTGIMALEYGGGAQARKIITWLYKDARVFLERKINKMEWW